MSSAEETLAIEAQVAPAQDNRQRGFRIALLCALVLHSALLFEANRTATGRRIGDATGKDDAIAVELVTEADLKSREALTVPPQGAAPAPPSPQPPPEVKREPQAQPQPQPQPPPQDQPPPQPETPPQEAKTPAPAPEPKPTEAKPQEPPKSEIPDFSSVLKDLATAPQPTDAAKPKSEPETEAKPQETPPAEASPPEKKAEPAKKKTARTTPAAPPATDFVPAGRSGISRPPGITRSGENDEFGLGVVRALRATMPPPTGGLGQVTVRLILNENGDLTDVTVLQSSGIAALDQRVVFATKQTNFPLPPYKSTVADRTFLIRYVYR